MAEADADHACKTTGEVLARLHRLGLYVTPRMIEDDTAAHYLPDRDTGHRGRGGASGLWEPWMERRAERLYRLRALDRRTHFGPTGNVLRLFLLLADGWGWEYVRETCVQGYRIAMLAAKRGVKNRVRGKELTLENLLWFAEDIAEDQYKPQDPSQAQIDRVKMTLGLLVLGSAPDGEMGTLEQITADLMPDAEPAEMAKFKEAGPLLWSLLATNENDAIRLLKGDFSEEIMRRAMHVTRDLIRRFRAQLRRVVKWDPKEKRPSLNPLTLYGSISDVRFHQTLRRLPHRGTPAQYLGAQIAQAVLIAYNEDRAVKAFVFWLEWFSFWLRSEDCTRWIQRMESEVRTNT